MRRGSTFSAACSQTLSLSSGGNSGYKVKAKSSSSSCSSSSSSLSSSLFSSSSCLSTSSVNSLVDYCSKVEHSTVIGFGDAKFGVTVEPLVTTGADEEHILMTADC